MSTRESIRQRPRSVTVMMVTARMPRRAMRPNRGAQSSTSRHLLLVHRRRGGDLEVSRERLARQQSEGRVLNSDTWQVGLYTGQKKHAECEESCVSLPSSALSVETVDD